MRRMICGLTTLAVLGLSGTAGARTAALRPEGEPPLTVEVRVTGTVEWNQVSAPPLGLGAPGDPVEMRFLLHTDQFVNGTVFPTRGYVIDPSSFVFAIGSGVVGLQNPFPPGSTPYFVLRNDDPAVDGFMLELDPDAAWPVGIPLEQVGIFGNFRDNFYVTYAGTVLESLDLAGALGTWDFNLLEVYNWTVDDDAFNAIGILFQQMTILEAGTLFTDGFESGDTSAWSSATPLAPSPAD